MVAVDEACQLWVKGRRIEEQTVFVLREGSDGKTCRDATASFVDDPDRVSPDQDHDDQVRSLVRRAECRTWKPVVVDVEP